MPAITTAIFVCATCRLETAPRPVVDGGLEFCCAGCAAGGPCTCSADLPQAAGAAEVRYCLDVRAALASTWPPEPDD